MLIDANLVNNDFLKGHKSHLQSKIIRNMKTPTQESLLNDITSRHVEEYQKPFNKQDMPYILRVFHFSNHP